MPVIEAEVQNQVRLLASKEGWRLWRNNVGAGELQNGSFVRWILETRGAGAVRTLYRTGSYEAALGMPLARAEREWRVGPDRRQREHAARIAVAAHHQRTARAEAHADHQRDAAYEQKRPAGVAEHHGRFGSPARRSGKPRAVSSASTARRASRFAQSNDGYRKRPASHPSTIPSANTAA